MPDTTPLFDYEAHEPLEIEPNPCIHAYGLGPEGKKCKTCSHLFRSWVTWFKCDLRRRMHGAATDHRANWRACGKYEEDEPV